MPNKNKQKLTKNKVSLQGATTLLIKLIKANYFPKMNLIV